MQTLTSEHDEAGEVVLHEYTNALDAVVVEGEKPIVRVEEGRLAYDLEAVSKGKAVNNAYEALTQLPGVSEQDGGLTLAGAGGVTVILNGKPSTMSAEQLASLLRSTPVERIEKAEVMYSTPPQYHVRGAAINLVLRRSHDYSFSGEVHANYTNRFYSNWDAGGNFAFSSPEWSADVTYAAGQAKTKRIIDLYSRHTLADGEHEIAQRQNITSKGTWHRLRAAAEYAPQGKGRLSIAYTGAYTPHTSGLVRADGNLVNSVSSPGGDQHDAQRCAALHVGLRARPLGGLHALQLVAAGRHAEQVRRRQPDSVRRGFGAVRRPGKCQRRPVARPGQWLGHDLRRHFQLGGRPRLPALQAPRGRHRHRRYRFAPRRIHGQPLCRGEQTVRQGEFLAVAGRGILPRGGLRQLVALPAGDPAPDTRRETSRTDFALVGQDLSLVLGDAAVDLLHRRLFGDPGHAGLRPSKSYNGQAMYMYKQKYIFMLFWNEMPDYFNQTAWQAPDRLALVYQTLNWNTNRQWGANVIVPLRLGKWLDSRLTLTGMRMTQRCDAFHDLAFDRSKWLGVVRMDNTIRLSRKPDLTLDLSGYYQSAAIQGTYDIDPSWSVNAGAKWTFDKSRASLSVRCNDIFESSLPFAKVRYKGQYLDMDSGTYTRSVTVHFSYRFGTYKEKRHKTVDTSRFGH